MKLTQYNDFNDYKFNLLDSRLRILSYEKEIGVFNV